MNTVASRDGTKIAYDREGAGPAGFALVLRPASIGQETGETDLP